MEKTKVSLFNPPTEAERGRIDSSVPPLGLCFISSVLDKEKYEVTGHNYINHEWYDAKELMKKDLLRIQPNVVGIQCQTYNRTACFKLAELVKEVLPKANVILGGPHATIFAQRILKTYSAVDFVVLGEAELTFKELLENLDNPERVKGIAYRLPLTGDLARITGFVNIEREIKITEPRELIKDLDSLPFPDLHLFDEAFRKTKAVRLESSRGCLFRCNFCSATKFWGNCWRAKSPKKVVDDMEQAHKQYPKARIYFVDSCITSDTKRMEEICNEILKRNLNVWWGGESRVDRVNPELLKMMRKGGCHYIAYGIESGSPTIIKKIGKGVTNKRVVEAFKMTREADIEPGLLLMIGQPGESQKTVNETKQLITQLSKYARVVDEVPPLQVYPDTLLYSEMVEKGLINDDWWFENEGVPDYYYEHSKEQLRKWASEIVFHTHIAQGLSHLISYSIKAFFQHPIKFTTYFFKRKYYLFLFKGWKK